jgi:hypothetical protein
MSGNLRRVILRRTSGWSCCAQCGQFSTERPIEARLEGASGWICMGCFEARHGMPGFAASIVELNQTLAERGDRPPQLLLLLAE